MLYLSGPLVAVTLPCLLGHRERKKKRGFFKKERERLLKCQECLAFHGKECLNGWQSRSWRLCVKFFHYLTQWKVDIILLLEKHWPGKKKNLFYLRKRWWLKIKCEWVDLEKKKKKKKKRNLGLALVDDDGHYYSKMISCVIIQHALSQSLKLRIQYKFFLGRWGSSDLEISSFCEFFSTFISMA